MGKHQRASSEYADYTEEGTSKHQRVSSAYADYTEDMEDRDRSILNELDAMERAIDRVLKITEAYEQRLMLITRPATRASKDSPGPAPVDDTLSPISYRLQNQRSVLSGASDHLESLCDRLDLPKD